MLQLLDEAPAAHAGRCDWWPNKLCGAVSFDDIGRESVRLVLV